MYSEYKIVSSIDNEQDIKKAFSEYKSTKSQLIIKISEYLQEEELADSDLKQYLEKITENYDKNIYLSFVERVLKNKNIIRNNRNKMLKYLEFFSKNNKSDCVFVTKDNLETYINSLHVNNNRLYYYLKKLYEEFEDGFTKNDSLQKKWYVEIPQEITLGEIKNDHRSHFDIFVQTKS